MWNGIMNKKFHVRKKNENVCENALNMIYDVIELKLTLNTWYISCAIMYEIVRDKCTGYNGHCESQLEIRINFI